MRDLGRISPHGVTTPRPEIDVEIDRLWRCAKLADDLDVAASYWQRHNDLVRQRAEQLAKAEAHA